MTTQERLERIRNRSTLYELVAQREGASQVLAGYCRIGKPGILGMLRKNGEAWTQRISATDLLTFDRHGHSATLGPFVIRFSGRTQRQAILEGELPFFTEAP